MKFATIVPKNFLNVIEDKPYHMALGHLIGVDAEYTEFYRKQSEMGHFVMLDNGVIETGEPLAIEVLCARAEMIGAKEIILPDVFLKKEETLLKSGIALDFVRRKYPNLKVMVVPQGENLDEWADCAVEMLTWPIDTLGVPKVLTKLGGRNARLTVLQHLGFLTRGVDVHLLGCWSDPLEYVTIHRAGVVEKQFPEVRGTDSAIPYVYARSSKKISQCERPEGEIDFINGDCDVEILKWNIDHCERAATATHMRDAVDNVIRLV